MALLDFINNRNATQQQPANKSQEQKPETAKEMYTRQAGQDRANEKPLHQMPPNEQAKLESIKATLEKATQHRDHGAHTPGSAQGDSAGNREAVRQNMTGQDKTAPALSPTSVQVGQTTGKDAQAPSNESPTKTPDKTDGRAQTMPRPRPSWER